MAVDRDDILWSVEVPDKDDDDRTVSEWDEPMLEIGVSAAGEWVDIKTGQPVPENTVATRLFDRGPARPLRDHITDEEYRSNPLTATTTTSTMTAITPAGRPIGFTAPLFKQYPHKNYDNIAKNLWQGAYPTVRANHKFKAILNTADFGAKYEVGDDVKTLAVSFYDDPSGLRNPDINLVELLADWVNERRAEGPVLVHCHMGLNRSGLVVAAALIREGMAPGKAIMTVRNRRADALFNGAFVGLLFQVRPK